MNARRSFLQKVAAGALLTPAVSTLSQSAFAIESPSWIIDTHQHLWDLERQNLPWLAGAPEVLRRTYHLPQYREATQGLRINAIYMEVAIDSSQLVEEADHVIGLSRDAAKETVGAVIGGRPESAHFRDYISRFQSIPEVKGVRRVLHESETPAGLCLQPDFVKNIQLLGQLGRSFDLCMRPKELLDGVKLAKLCPDTRFIVDHCGNADPKSFRNSLNQDELPSHTVDEWKAGIDQLAKLPNVICKISGAIARLPKGGDANDLAPIVNFCLDTFGPDRVVFGSDWPVCLLGGSLKKWVELLSQIISSRPNSDQIKLWSGNAVRFYGLNV
jgi:L-fuconolactonase